MTELNHGIISPLVLSLKVSPTPNMSSNVLQTFEILPYGCCDVSFELWKL